MLAKDAITKKVRAIERMPHFARGNRSFSGGGDSFWDIVAVGVEHFTHCTKRELQPRAGVPAKSFFVIRQLR